MIPIHLDERALDAGLVAYLAAVGTDASRYPELRAESSEQLAEGMRACIRAYLSFLPTDRLIDQLRRHADAEVDNTIRYIVNADHLMRQAADRISMLEAELAEVSAKLLRAEDLAAGLDSTAMNKSRRAPHIPADVRAAISAFLSECQKNTRPFAVSEALDAVRRIFPELEVSDDGLLDAIASEASSAGFDTNFCIPAASETPKRIALERWDNEGGAIGGYSSAEAQQRSEDDSKGAKRRAKEQKTERT
ncbi:hypothetical protein [uncultured Nitratireductor sp.]|uniref:hypothetical protein n=1 Tax=uncultured Nitratireductor sp. TaxID=520953 RepID=UPI00260F4EF9|nr:hypothetical protein [uncultured Nitratireductor sp.]